MSFKESCRNFWMKASNEKCQYEYYDEKMGWQTCNRPAKHTHHIKGEAETILEGKNPDNNTGMPLCEQHHVRNMNDEPHSKYFSFHPDMGHAYKAYREWKRQKMHLNEICGKTAIDYSDSPFAEAAKDHVEMAKRGERYISGTPEIDKHYEQKMIDNATKYVATTGEKKKGYPNYNRKRKWYDNFFDGKDDNGT